MLFDDLTCSESEFQSARESMENIYKGSPEKKELGRQWYRVWKKGEIEQGATEEISGVGCNKNIEETVWQP